MSDYILSHKSPGSYAIKCASAWIFVCTITVSIFWVIALNIWVAICAMVLGGDLFHDVVKLWLHIKYDMAAAAWLGFFIGLLTAIPVYVVAAINYGAVMAKHEKQGQS